MQQHSGYSTARVALETTLLLHGVPKASGAKLGAELSEIVRQAGAVPCLVGVEGGRAVTAMDGAGLVRMLGKASTPKVNTGTLGVALAGGGDGATTVSTTMEMAAMAGIRVFATGGLGGVHKGLGDSPGGRLDISADLMAFTRFPVAVVTSGCKSILDVINTREFLETLGVPVVGWKTDRFPAFYTRDGGIGLDARFDDMGGLAKFVRHELARTRRGVVVCNAVPEADEIDAEQFAQWLHKAEERAREHGAVGRAVTPAVLGALHELSDGVTLRANIALVKSNAKVAAELAVAMAM